MMIRNRFVLKSVAALLILLTLNNLFFPALSYALTAGPTAPEYTSFEPVDTTDMVNLATGDFTYNIPLLEVPGPEGGYPLSLSYHAGIQPGVEASWVGLGWTLNSGAINRTVNGYPDDHHGAKRTVTDTWQGGETSALSVGVGLPGANFGLTFAQDTYRGFGVGTNFGVGIGIGGDNSPLGVGVNFGAGPYGGAYASVGISAGVPMGGNGNEGDKSAARLGGSIGVSTNFKSVSTYAGAGVSAGGASLMGASISSNGLKPRFSVGGTAINQVNSNASRIKEETSSFSVPFPIGPGAWLNIGYNYRRYYTNEESTVDTWGALYHQLRDPDENAYDSYPLVDVDAASGIADQNPEHELGGSLMAADIYNVTGQGVGGTMQYHSYFNRDLYRQNRKVVDSDDRYLVRYETLSTTAPTVPTNSFRFNHDFSNTAHFKNTPEIVYMDAIGEFSHIGLNHSQSTIPSEGLGPKGQLAGTKHIAYFTNQQVANGTAFADYGFVAPKRNLPFSDGSSRGRDNATSSYRPSSKQIGGFMITNESGVTYHYGLPVYTFGEHIHTEWLDEKGKKYTNDQEQPQPYAYTWLLTAITGPDYVSRGGGNTISEQDWGYWVKFDYGMWTDNYQWRNPATEMHKDIKRSYQNYSYGTKELFYLNAIRTRTHTALFVKEIRADGKGVTDSEQGGFDIEKQSAIVYTGRSVVNGPSSINSGRSTSRGSSADRSSREVIKTNPVTIGEYNKMPVSTLRLAAIHLLKNDAFEQLGGNSLYQNSDTYHHQWEFSKTIEEKSYTLEETLHYGKNVLDVHDVKTIGLPEKAIRVIDFTHQYALQPGTPNSYDAEGDMYQYLTTTPTDGFRYRYKPQGKLTLKQLAFLGKKGEGLIPAMTFGYDEENPKKNPPYDAQSYDMWGSYKRILGSVGDENVARLTTAKSAKDVDAWSLKEINTSLGAKISINYSSDVYRTPALYRSSIIQANSATPLEISEGRKRIRIGLSNYSEYAESYVEDLKTIGKINFLFLLRKPFQFQVPFDDGYNCEGGDKVFYSGVNAGNTYETFSLDEGEYTLVEVDKNSVVIECPAFYDKLTSLDNNVYRYKEVHEDDSKCINRNNNAVDPLIKYDTYRLVGGNAFFASDAEKYGGGLRVETIATSDNRKSYVTRYAYRGGTTTYEPTGLEQYAFRFVDQVNGESVDWEENKWIAEQERIQEAKKAYKNQLYRSFYGIIVNAREIPPPGVVYAQTSVSQEIHYPNQEIAYVPGSQVYHFQTFEPRAVQKEGYRANVEGSAKTVVIKDYSAHVGQVKAIQHYGAEGQLLTEQINHYLLDEVGYSGYKAQLLKQYEGQGLISQIATEVRKVSNTPKQTRSGFKGVVTVKEEYPAVVVGSTTINHKTGLTTSTRNLAFDFFSGQPTKVLSEDSYGNKYVSVTTPAYHLYEGMGPKVKTPTNKHMLTQGAEQITYKINPDFDPKEFPQTDYVPQGLVGASVQTWTDQVPTYNHQEQVTAQQSNIWRKHRSVQWIGEEVALQQDGTAPVDDFNLFTDWYYTPPVEGEPEPSPSDAQWEEQSRITRYNVYSNPLEARDLNQDFAATHLDDEQQLVLATAANARYDEFAYFGAERERIDNSTALSLPPGTTLSNRYAHTGQRSVAVPSKQKGVVWNGTKADLNRTYRASVWVYASQDDDAQRARLYASGGATRTAGQTQVKAGAWQLIILDVPAGQSTLEIGCENPSGSTVYFDDFRVHPLDAAMSSYVYDEQTDELTHILNTDNFYTRFEYDAMGRLVASYQEIQHPVEKQLSKQVYNYGKTR